MVYPSIVLSVLFIALLASSSQATFVVSCMLCNILSEPLRTEMTPTATVNAMFDKCDRMGLMEPICSQFVSENVKNMFIRVRQGTSVDSVCKVMRLCDA